MLIVHMGSDDKEIKHPSVYFKNTYLDEWFDDPFVKQIVKEVDNTTVISANQMTNPLWGPCNATRLSNGTRNLILAYKTDCTIDGSMMGENCWPILQQIARIKDVRICMYGPIWWEDPLEAYFEDSQKYVHSAEEFGFEYLRLYQKGSAETVD